MKRLWRWLFNLATVMSLLLCVAAGMLWARSGSIVDQIILSRPYREASLVSGGGALRLMCADLDYATPQYMLDDGKSIPPPSPLWSMKWERDTIDGLPDRIIRNDPTPWVPALLPIRLDRGTPSTWFRESPPFWDGWQVTIPYYVLFLASAFAPASFVLIKWRRRMPHAKALCAVCGYDLRATPDRCPECGMVPEVPKEAT